MGCNCRKSKGTSPKIAKVTYTSSVKKSGRITSSPRVPVPLRLGVKVKK
jgi:hypothetical protein